MRANHMGIIIALIGLACLIYELYSDWQIVKFILGLFGFEL